MTDIINPRSKRAAPASPDDLAVPMASGTAALDEADWAPFERFTSKSDTSPLLALELSDIEKVGENSVMAKDSNHSTRLAPLLGTKTPAGVAPKSSKNPQNYVIFQWILMPRVSRCFRPCPHNPGHGTGHMPRHAPSVRKVMPQECL
jgi:hypothetical protein